MRLRHRASPWLAAFVLGGQSALGLASFGARELLDCDGDPEWAAFRERLVENAAQGYPLDPELAFQAQDLLQKHQHAMDLNAQNAYGAAEVMQGFFAACNAASASSSEARPADEEAPPACLFGSVAALWVVARAGHPDGERLLAHAEFLLGKTMRSTLDFMESSGWPLSSLDVLGNLQRQGGDFRLPGELAEEYTTPHARASTQQVPSSSSSSQAPPVRFVVWEVGVHASLSAEPLQMWARFVLPPGATLAHRNLIRDQYPQWLPNKCESLYQHESLSCDEVEDELTDLFRQRIPRSSSSKDPIDSMDEFKEEFQALARPHLSSVDALLCTVAYLCLLFEGLGKPLLGYFGHPVLFMVPRDDAVREDFWSRFVRLAAHPQVGLAVSDPFLQMQFEYQVGAPRLPAIRTHALYTGATHYPARANDVLVLDRPHECVVMCLIRRLMDDVGRAEPHSSGSTRYEEEDTQAEQREWSTSEGRLRVAASPHYLYKFFTRSALSDRSFHSFAQFRAVVLWPYDMDLITFYEFYAMGMPLFMPSHLPKYLFQQDHMDYAGRWAGRKAPVDGRPELWPGGSSASPFEETSLDAVRYTAGFSDYFRFPEVQYFRSIPDLLDRLPRTDFFQVAQGMARYNQKSLTESSNAWRALLRRTTSWDAEKLQL